jgi:hypothetical protein
VAEYSGTEFEVLSTKCVAPPPRPYLAGST